MRIYKYKIEIKEISKNQTIFFKSIGILLIVFHNFYRWITPITGENEFSFKKDNIINSFYYLIEEPLDFLNISFNYLGHYGVQIFIFISAYGLTKSYYNNKVSWRVFMLKRLKKIYPAFLLAVWFFIVYNVYQHNVFFSWDELKNCLLQLTLLANFFPEKALVSNGPWWFYSLIFQIYLIFPLTIFFYERFKIHFLILISIISYLLIFLLNNTLINNGLNFFYLFVGHIPINLMLLFIVFHRLTK